MARIMEPIDKWTIWDPVAGRSKQAIKPRLMTIHTAVVDAQDIYGPRLGPGRTHSHFFNPRSGKLRQHQEINRQAFADGGGNPYCVSVEHWDGYPRGAPGYWKNSGDVPPLTDSQIENDARLFAYLVQNFGLPNRIATPGNVTGLGWHRLGIAGNFGKFDANDRKTWSRAQTGLNFSNARGKLCPGDRRIGQIPEIFARAQEYLTGKKTSRPVTPPASTSSVYYPTRYLLDCDPGPATWSAVQSFLADRGYYKRVVDGVPGYYTWAALQAFLSDLGYFGPAPSGRQDMTTARALQRWLTNTGYYKGEVDARWTDDLWLAVQRFMRYAHKGTKTYPLNPPPTPTPTKEAGPFMALTEKQQDELYDKTMKSNHALGRLEKYAIPKLEAEMAATQAVVGTLANAQGLDPGLVQKTIEDAVEKALAGLSITLTAMEDETDEA